MNYAPGQIVLVDWRDGLPKEPNKKRPAVVVEDRGLFDDAYPNLILAPLAEDPHLAIADLSVQIPPTAENGCTKPCCAGTPCHHHLEASNHANLFTHYRRTACGNPAVDRHRHRVGLSVRRGEGGWGWITVIQLGQSEVAGYHALS